MGDGGWCVVVCYYYYIIITLYYIVLLYLFSGLRTHSGIKYIKYKVQAKTEASQILNIHNSISISIPGYLFKTIIISSTIRNQYN